MTGIVPRSMSPAAASPDPFDYGQLAEVTSGQAREIQRRVVAMEATRNTAEGDAQGNENRDPFREGLAIFGIVRFENVEAHVPGTPVEQRVEADMIIAARAHETLYRQVREWFTDTEHSSIFPPPRCVTDALGALACYLCAQSTLDWNGATWEPRESK